MTDPRTNPAPVRLLAENRARVCLVQLLYGASLLLTGLTRLLPLAGCAAWWTLLLMLLPGLAAYGLARLAMRLLGASTLPEMARSLLGRVGGVALTGLLGALLLLEAARSVDALVTLFTDGVGSRGTPLTLALVTCGALGLCLWRGGLARGVQLLRWPMLAGCAVAAAALMPLWRADHLFPLQGGGMPGVMAALRAGAPLTWPLLTLLTIPADPARGRLHLRWVPPLVGAAGALLILCLTVPQEILTTPATLAQQLTLPWRYAPPAARLLMLCLLLTALFLAIAAAVELATAQLCAPWGRRPAWLPGALLLALALTQAVEVRAVLTLLQGVLAIPLGGFCAVVPVIAVLRRLRR
ncbi:MAG: hypothetical protein IJE07_06460 [Clostridia bacterium]|nr:hypothetical protein [Clostridia bacterium]